MRLINVEAFLGLAAQKIEVLKRFNDEELRGIRYAALSHCWCAKGLAGELRFKELDKSTPETIQGLRNRPDCQKIVESCSLAHKRGLEWLWADTCCIVRENKSELSEAINSMYRWYKNSEICFAYLHDVKYSLPTEPNIGMFPTPKGWPTWFSCSWTLQELLAPRHVHFFDQDWRLIGDKAKLAHKLTRITGIPVNVLTNGLPHPDDPCRPSAAQIMSWAADRKTCTREDRAYALVGIFGVHMPTNYGESDKAFHRLQVSIIKEYNDHSIFAWSGKSRPGSVLADDPSYFQGSAEVVRLDPCVAFIRQCPGDKEYIEDHEFFKVTEDGVEIWLPITFGCDSEHQPCVQAKLACCLESKSGELITLDLVSVLLDPPYSRGFGKFSLLYKDLAFDRIRLTLKDDYTENRAESSHTVGVPRYGSLPALDRLLSAKELPQSPSASTWPQVFRSWYKEAMQNVSTRTPLSSNSNGSSMQHQLRLNSQPNATHSRPHISSGGNNIDPPSDVSHLDFRDPEIDVGSADFTTFLNIFHQSPSGEAPNDSTTLCGWVDRRGNVCGEPITNDCARHLATAHGITKKSPDSAITCGWCSKQMKRESMLRHVRERHLGKKRKRTGKDKGRA
ncbi:hypothetical protein SCLCIDRAFT_1225001 [Scleroderma citrinum Foug A]|uniref:Heterokaryon incompatibility domain-containing protein n=1 Tax=Scleroderma citrinum Foug A TaxID=1036808 RepID=A0A0C3D3C7_9AGAM|nr:hypothetical protein SCLCIDRAFT_1225001 [Scleroderma citrinum Foug A]